MRVLLDNNVDRRFARLLVGHEVTRARQRGWSDFHNGDLIKAAEEEGFEVLITVDKNMRYQQNLKGRTISIVTLSPLLVDFSGIEPLVPRVLIALENLTAGSFITLSPE